jgi:hypothetical protein
MLIVGSIFFILLLVGIIVVIAVMFSSKTAENTNAYQTQSTYPTVISPTQTFADLTTTTSSSSPITSPRNTGNVTTISTTGLSGPRGLSLSSSKVLYAANLNTHTISAITLSGSVRIFAGNGTAGYADGINV